MTTILVIRNKLERQKTQSEFDFWMLFIFLLAMLLRNVIVVLILSTTQPWPHIWTETKEIREKDNHRIGAIAVRNIIFLVTLRQHKQNPWVSLIVSSY